MKKCKDWFTIKLTLCDQSSVAVSPGLLVRSCISPLLTQALRQALDPLAGVAEHPPLIHRMCQIGLLQCIPPHWQHQQHLQ